MLYVGARPQFIKALPLIKAFLDAGVSRSELLFVHSGQHYDELMSEVIFSDLGLPAPDYHMKTSHVSFGSQLGDMVDSLMEVIAAEKIERVIVFGDTNTTLAGALAAKRANCILVHIEAGLRSNDWSMPEEQNRIVVDRLSDILFTPNKKSTEVAKEEAKTATVVECGDIMLDALQLFKDKLNQAKYPSEIFFTLHRQSNTDSEECLRSILKGVNRLGLEEGYKICFPVHPRTLKALKHFKVDLEEFSSIHFCDPLSYTETLAQIKKSKLVITDSGGLQKEAYFLKKPVLVARETTEWTEIIESGWGFLVGSNPEEIMTKGKVLLSADLTNHIPFYGAGNSAEIIVKTLL